MAHGSQGIFLYQHRYALEIMEESGLFGSKPIDFPMEENHKLGLNKGRVLDGPSQYRF